MIYFTSDLHLGGAERSSNHTFKDEFENKDIRSKHLIDNINSKVKNDDTLYILGDFINADAQADKYINAINCNNIYVLCGNHDHWLDDKEILQQFKNKIHILTDVDIITRDDKILPIQQMVKLPLNDYTFYLCHYPGGTKSDFSKFPELPEKSCILCGHEHNEPKFTANAAKSTCNIINVGASYNNYFPYSLNDITFKVDDLDNQGKKNSNESLLKEGMTQRSAFKYLIENFI